MLSVVLLTIAHPGIYASALQDGQAQIYKAASQPLVHTRGSESGAEYGYEMERH
jgi:hypothetical protein